MTFTPQETEFLVSLLRQVNVNAANPQAQQTIALTQALLSKLAAQDGAGHGVPETSLRHLPGARNQGGKLPERSA